MRTNGKGTYFGDELKITLSEALEEVENKNGKMGYKNKGEDKEYYKRVFNKYGNGNIISAKYDEDDQIDFGKASEYDMDIDEKTYSRLTGKYKNNVDILAPVLADDFNKKSFSGKRNWTEEKVKNFLREGRFVIHETAYKGNKKIQLVPDYIHDRLFKHNGLRAKIRNKQVSYNTSNAYKYDVNIEKKATNFRLLGFLVLVGVVIFVFLKLKLNIFNFHMRKKEKNNIDLVENADEPFCQYDEYKITKGRTFYQIADIKYSNKHYWPIIYYENRELHDDPDVIDIGEVVKCPKDINKELNLDSLVKIYSYVFEAYNRINKHNRAVKVLASGELICPGFLEEMKSQLSDSDYLAASESVKNTR